MKIIKTAQSKRPLFEGLTDLHESVPLWQNAEIQYPDVVQMADILQRYRSRVRAMVRSYRYWKADYAQQADALEKAYTGYEGIFLRRQLGDAWLQYAKVNRDYHLMRRGFLASLRQPPYYGHGAK